MFRLPLIAAVSYLLGSIPFGYLLVRIFRGEDVRLAGSGNIGATNVSRKSPALGVSDAPARRAQRIRGRRRRSLPLPALFRSHLDLRNSLAPVAPPASREFAFMAALAALFAVVGHIFPIWLNFRGGKGVATGLGAFLMIAPKSVLLAATSSSSSFWSSATFL